MWHQRHRGGGFGCQLRCDVIVTDHHTPGPKLPAAVAVINPKLPNSAYPFADLAGVGVALKLVQALGGLAEAVQYLDLATLGTIADIVPLVDENRVIVRFGLEALRDSQRPGLQALLREAELGETQLKPGQVSFMLAPRLNAAGRLNQSEQALRLLLTEDEQEAKDIAALLTSFNEERQAIEQMMVEEAEAMAEALPASERRFIVLAKEGWHPGVVGIVASRLVERFYRPVILLAIDGNEAQGSGRSIPRYDLVQSLRQQADLLTSFGGHQAAAGLSLPVENIPALRQALNQHVCAVLQPADLIPVTKLDVELDPSEVTLELVHSLEKLGPYGPGHPEPVFCSKRWQVTDIRQIGRDGQHLKLYLSGGGMPWEALAWRSSHELPQLRQTEWLDVAYTLQYNVWRGQESVVLHLRDWRVPVEDDSVPVYDARFVSDRNAYLQSLLEQEETVLVLFWPAFACLSWPQLWRQLGITDIGGETGPMFLRQVAGKWRLVAGSSLDDACTQVWLDVPHGLPSLERLVDELGARLYRHRIHLLYNGNDIERAYAILKEHGPSRQALAVLYRGLQQSPEKVQWLWEELYAVMQRGGYLGLPDQISLHLQVLQELSLAECACTNQGASVNWLPRPPVRQDLADSPSYAQAMDNLQGFAAAMDWLRSPDAGNIVARYLIGLLKERKAGNESL